MVQESALVPVQFCCQQLWPCWPVLLSPWNIKVDVQHNFSNKSSHRASLLSSETQLYIHIIQFNSIQFNIKFISILQIYVHQYGIIYNICTIQSIRIMYVQCMYSTCTLQYMMYICIHCSVQTTFFQPKLNPNSLPTPSHMRCDKGKFMDKCMTCTCTCAIQSIRITNKHIMYMYMYICILMYIAVSRRLSSTPQLPHSSPTLPTPSPPNPSTPNPSPPNPSPHTYALW